MVTFYDFEVQLWFPINCKADERRQSSTICKCSLATVVACNSTTGWPEEFRTTSTDTYHMLWILDLPFYNVVELHDQQLRALTDRKDMLVYQTACHYIDVVLLATPSHVSI